MKKTWITISITIGVLALGIGVYSMTVPNNEYVPTAEEVREANAKILSLQLEIQEKVGLIASYENVDGMEAEVMVLEDQVKNLQTELDELVETNEENIEE